MPTGSSQFITRPVQELLGRNPGYGFAGTGVSVAIGNYTDGAYLAPARDYGRDAERPGERRQTAHTLATGRTSGP